MSKSTFTTFEISKICGVYPTTVINWIKQGKLKAFSTPGGHHRIAAADLKAFLAEYNFPVPAFLSGARKRVLLVDDDVTFTKMVSRVLDQRKDVFEVEVLHDGYAALMAVGKKAPDLLIIDVVMPVMDGPTVCRNIKADPTTKDVKIIAVTGERLTPEGEKAIRRHFDSFMHKPVDVDQLLKKALRLSGAEPE